MATTNWKCPKHNLKLYTIPDYPGALLCPAVPQRCPDIFVLIEGRLCRQTEQGCFDVKTNEKLTPKS